MSVKKRIQIAYDLLKQTCQVLDQPLKKSVLSDLSNLQIYMNTLSYLEETEQMQIMSVKILHDTFLLCLKQLTKKYQLQFSIFNESNYFQQVQDLENIRQKEYTEQQVKNMFYELLITKKNKQVHTMNFREFINRYKIKIKREQEG